MNLQPNRRRAAQGGAVFAAILIWGQVCLAATSAVGISDFRLPESYLPGGHCGQVNSFPAQIGETQIFWAYAQGFFTGYYRLSATCQDTGANTYVFTEDAYINDLTASTINADTIIAAANGGMFRSLDGGDHWSIFVAGLPTATGSVGALDSSEYNHRCLMHSLFSRSEYGGNFDTVWVGTEYGPFWRAPAQGDSFVARGNRMPTDADGFKPETFDILGHPTETRTLWAATEDGVYMTRGAKNWSSIGDGLPPSEGTIWEHDPAYALSYDAARNLLFAATNKGVFYGTPRFWGSVDSPTIIASWKPLGGEITVAADTSHPATADSLRLAVDDTSSQGFVLGAGQSITVVDPASGVYWTAFVDISDQGLFAILSDSGLFYYPTGTTLPAVNYAALNVDSLVAYAYSQVAGNAIYTEMQDSVTTVLVGTDAGLLTFQFIGDIADRYETEQEIISTDLDTLAIYKIAQGTNGYYLATQAGLLQASSLGASWDFITGSLYNNSHTDSTTADVRTIAFGPDSVIFIGGHLGGFLRAENGSDFAPSNWGMMHRVGTAGQIDLFLNEFEHSAAADSTQGIIELMQDWWGSLPNADSPQDVDHDARVTVLFLDIDDQYYLDTGDGTYINGYYDAKNEFPLTQYAHSNVREMFYLDNDPQWINEAGAPACNQTFNLINWNQDASEETWLREGMASFSQWVGGYPLAPGTMASPISFPVLNNLTSWGDDDRDGEHLYSFLLVLYLYERYFPDTAIADSLGDTTAVIHNLQQLATSDYHGVSGLGRLIYERTVGLSSPDVDYTYVFRGVFNDFVLAGALDISQPGFFDGRYGFENIEIKIAANSYDWYFPPSNPTQPPFAMQIPFWSARAIQISDVSSFNDLYPIDTLLVNGDNNNLLNFTLLFSFAGNFAPEMSPANVAVVHINTDSLTQNGMAALADSLQLGNGSAQPNIMRLVTSCASNNGTSESTYLLDDDTSPPSYIYQTVAQNPIDDRYLDIYTFCDERLFPDGGQLYNVDAAGLTALEGPLVAIQGAQAAGTSNDTTITLDENVFFSNPAASSFIYHIAYHLEGIQFPAALSFLSYGEDAAGNQDTSQALLATIDFISNEAGGYVLDQTSGADLTIGPGALPRDAYAILSVSPAPQYLAPETAYRGVASGLDDSHYPVGPLVSAGCSGLDLSSPVEITVPYDPILVGNRDVGVYRSEGNGWVYIGGQADQVSGLLHSYSWKFGQFQVMAGPLGDFAPEMPYTFKLDQNFPNPFNPSTRIQFELGYAQRVRLEVYDVSGRLVEKLADRLYPAGQHEIAWLPSSRLASGIYFFRLVASEGALYRKMLLLK